MDAILEIFILSGVSYLIYAICMGRNVSYAVRRRYLLISIPASGIIPFVEIPVEVSVAQEIYQVLHYNSGGTENEKTFILDPLCCYARILYRMHRKGRNR